jgi:hypothetical protein
LTSSTALLCETLRFITLLTTALQLNAFLDELVHTLPPDLRSILTDFCHVQSPSVTFSHLLSPSVTLCLPLSPSVTLCHALSHSLTLCQPLSPSHVIQMFLSLRFVRQSSTFICLLPGPCYMPLLFYPLPFNHPNNVWLPPGLRRRSVAA